MKRLLTVTCMLASTIGVSSVALTSKAGAQTSAAEPPSAPEGPAPAYPAGPSKIAVIIFQQAVAQTNEGQRNFAQLRDKFAPKQAQLKAQSDEVDSLKKQLQDAGTNLSEQDRDAKLRTIDEKTKALQRVAEDDQNDFNTQMNDMYQALAQKVYTTVDSYAKQNGFTVVLDASNQQSSPVLWINPGVDITKAIVDAYNASSGIPAQPAGASTPRPATRPSTTTPHSTTTRPSTSTTPKQ